MVDSVFIEDYFETFAQALATVSPSDLHDVIEILRVAQERKSRVFIAGNGGSASLASHFACDLEKTVGGPRPRSGLGLRAQSLGDNLATLTAWANDEGYDVVFAEQLRAQAEPGDVLVVISASGNSPNIVAALEAAAEIAVSTVAIVGFDGGRALTMAQHPIHVKSDDYGVIEGAHGVLTHLITAALVRAAAERHDAQPVAGPVAPVRLAATGAGKG